MLNCNRYLKVLWWKITRPNTRPVSSRCQMGRGNVDRGTPKKLWSMNDFLKFQNWCNTIRIKKKDALLNDWLLHWKSKKLAKILDHFEALEKLFHLAPIWCLYQFSFGNGIILSKTVAKFVFAVPLKKMQFSKIVSHFKEL